jgi:hypothetical protein
MTKNDIYAFIVDQGTSRGYSVIPEFAVYCPRKKLIDLVWATRRYSTPKFQDKTNLEYWNLEAIFEIEGCNVPLSHIRKNKEIGFQRHLDSFPLIKNTNGSSPLKFVILYTEAFDRAWGSDIDRQVEVDKVVVWGEGDILAVHGPLTVERAILDLPRSRP